MPTAIEVPSPPPEVYAVNRVITARASRVRTELAQSACSDEEDGSEAVGQDLYPPCEETLH